MEIAMNKLIKMSLVGALLTAPVASLAATGLTGKWVDKTDSTVTMTVSNGVATVVANCGPRYGGGKFSAHAVVSGKSLTLKGPIVHGLMAKKPHSWQPFLVHFQLKGGQLIEVKPYPLETLVGVGYWHGASCGFNFTDMHAAPNPIYPAVFVRAK
jgi:hypothetical protein